MPLATDKRGKRAVRKNPLCEVASSSFKPSSLTLEVERAGKRAERKMLEHLQTSLYIDHVYICLVKHASSRHRAAIVVVSAASLRQCRDRVQRKFNVPRGFIFARRVSATAEPERLWSV